MKSQIPSKVVVALTKKRREIERGLEQIAEIQEATSTLYLPSKLLRSNKKKRKREKEKKRKRKKERIKENC